MAYQAALQAGLSENEAVAAVNDWASRTNYGENAQPVYNLGGAQRSQIPSSDVGNAFAKAVSDYNPTLTAEVFSGQEPPGRAPVGARHRHPPGYAVDTYVRDMAGNRINDRNVTDEVAFNFVQGTGGNVGRGGRGYMNYGANHYDIAPLRPGMGQLWGDTNPGFAQEMQQARMMNNQGLTDQSMLPVPRARGESAPYGFDDRTPERRLNPMENIWEWMRGNLPQGQFSGAETFPPAPAGPAQTAPVAPVEQGQNMPDPGRYGGVTSDDMYAALPKPFDERRMGYPDPQGRINIPGQTEAESALIAALGAGAGGTMPPPPDMSGGGQQQAAAPAPQQQQQSQQPAMPQMPEIDWDLIRSANLNTQGLSLLGNSNQFLKAILGGGGGLF